MSSEVTANPLMYASSTPRPEATAVLRDAVSEAPGGALDVSSMDIATVNVSLAVGTVVGKGVPEVGTMVVVGKGVGENVGQPATVSHEFKYSSMEY